MILAFSSPKVWEDPKRVSAFSFPSSFTFPRSPSPSPSLILFLLPLLLPSYPSQPNRIKGSPHSTKSDIWSFGIVILECAVGHYPYGHDTPNTTFFSRLTDIVNKPAPIPQEGKFSKEFMNFITIW